MYKIIIIKLINNAFYVQMSIYNTSNVDHC